MDSRRIAASLGWKMLERVGVKGIGFVVGVVLARLLDPNLFGMLAVMTAIAAIAQVIIEGGLSVALIQNKTADEGDYSAVFFISLAVAVVLYAVLFFCAPLIADFYGSSEMVAPFRVLCLMLLFGAFNSVQTAKLVRGMQFKAVFACSMITTVVAGVVGITLAVNGFGLWALVIYQLLYSVLSCITMMCVVDWHPSLKLIAGKTRIVELVSFGWKILVSGLLCSLFQNIRTLIVGKAFSATDLGYYNRGEQLPSTIASTIDSVFSTVMLPVMSADQEDVDKVKATLSRTVKVNAYMITPILLGLIASAGLIIDLLFTSKWLPCVPYMRVFCLSYITVAVSSPCLIAIKALGRSDTYLRLEIVRRTLMLLILIVSVVFFDSVMAIVIGWLISSILDTIVIMVPTRRLIGYRWRDLFRDITLPILMSCVMVLAIYAIGLLVLPEIIVLCLQIIIGLGIYFALSMLFKVNIPKQLVQMFRKTE